MTAHTGDETPSAAPAPAEPATRRRRPRLPPLLIAALGPIQWGVNPLVVTELTIHGRFMITALCSALPVGLAVTAAFRSLPEGRWWWRYLVLSWCNFAVSTPLFYYGMQHMPGGIATILIATQPLFAMLLSLPILGVRPTRTQLCSVAAGFVGVALIMFKGQARLDVTASALLLASAVTAALGLVLTKRWSPPVPALQHNGWQLLLAGLTLLPMTFFFEGFPSHLTWRNVLGFAIIGFLSKLLGFGVMFHAVPRLGATTVALLTLLTPTTAFLLGFLFKGEALTYQQAFGVVIVLSSVILGGRLGATAPERRQASGRARAWSSRTTLGTGPRTAATRPGPGRTPHR